MANTDQAVAAREYAGALESVDTLDKEIAELEQKLAAKKQDRADAQHQVSETYGRMGPAGKAAAPKQP